MDQDDKKEVGITVEQLRPQAHTFLKTIQFVKLISALMAASTLVASPLNAADVSSQPLTRADCDKADMTWDDRANVCAAKPKGSQAQAASGSEGETSANDTSGQPLTRVDCDKAGMAWNDSANVCGPVAGEATAETAPNSEAPETAWSCANVCRKAQTASEAPPEALTEGTASQPLTRIDCDKAGMVWNESANVCGEPVHMQIVAHEDDDFLFMNPDIQNDIDQGLGIVTVYVTAGEANGGGRKPSVKSTPC
jgi:hypothetical protein